MRDFDPPAIVRGVQDASCLVAEAKAARTDAEAAEEHSSPHRWREADAYAKLAKQDWTQRRIAEECGTNQTSVCHFIKCVIGYPIKDKRPRFWDAYAEVTGEKKTAHVANNSGEVEWYTPAEYLDAARGVLGGIDLDPASSAVAQRLVQARKYFTKEDDGLGKSWAGRVWMNPPYASGLVDRFVDKLAAHYAAGDVTAAVCLVNNATDTKWFRQGADTASAICFPTGRVRFLRPDGEEGAPLQGQAVLYLGEDVDKFIGAFTNLGFCVEVRRP